MIRNWFWDFNARISYTNCESCTGLKFLSIFVHWLRPFNPGIWGGFLPRGADSEFGFVWGVTDRERFCGFCGAPSGGRAKGEALAVGKSVGVLGKTVIRNSKFSGVKEVEALLKM
jgi:hypothetical protein